MGLSNTEAREASAAAKAKAAEDRAAMAEAAPEDEPTTRYEVRISNLVFLVDSPLDPRALRIDVTNHLKDIGKAASPIGVSIR